MKMLILKTNINLKDDFISMKNSLSRSFDINECTIDLDDTDKVVRVIGRRLNKNEVLERINSLGYVCEELPD
ncbi:MAG TPA: hypothetical protein VKD08_13000 [Ignavibacteriaceae bacterium]|nr:hypothetical protein [Ignavibacteriaceae bacterium]